MNEHERCGPWAVDWIAHRRTDGEPGSAGLPPCSARTVEPVRAQAGAGSIACASHDGRGEAGAARVAARA